MIINVQNGADPNKKNRDGHTPLDLVKEGDTDVEDLLRGNGCFGIILRLFCGGTAAAAKVNNSVLISCFILASF